MRMRFVVGTSVLALTALVSNPVFAQPSDGVAPSRDRQAQPGQRERGERSRGAEGEQRRERPAQLSATDSESAWVLQAQGVAYKLGLDQAAGEQLVDVYIQHRKSMATAMKSRGEEMRGQRKRGEAGERPQRDGEAGERGERPQRERGGEAGERGERPQRERGGEAGERNQRGGRGGPGEVNNAMIETMNKHKEAFKADLASILSAEQVDAVAFSLGTFNTGWDRMVHSLANMGLEDGNLVASLNVVADHIDSTSKARAAQREARQSDRAAQQQDGAVQQGQDRSSGERRTREQSDRSAQQESLFAGLSAYLSDSQMGAFKKEHTRPERPQRGRGEQGSRAGERRERGNRGEGREQRGRPDQNGGG